jgi:hypothetical protein
VSDELVAFLILLGAPVVLGGLFWLIAILERDAGDEPGRTPFDPPPWWW